MQKTTRQGLKVPEENTPQVLCSTEEPLNSTSLETSSNVNSPVENSKPLSHLGCGCNSSTKKRRNVRKHLVFVLGVDGKPLTPCKESKARKLMEGQQAKPVWNKFGQFGIQMIIDTRKETPNTVLGIDNGTKFEGYSVLSGKENVLNVMWKLPDNKKLVKKLEERRTLRRSRRQRNCRRRESRFDNRERKGVIAPSQLQVVNSRMKSLQEFFKCYPIDTVAMEDVKFNHSKKIHGKNFSTIEIGKTKIKDWIKERSYLQLFTGMDTQDCRERYGYKKSSSKSAEIFNSHCSDALALATEIYVKEYIQEGKLVIVDDTYRYVRRRLHDTQFAEGGVREKYSTGNFKGIRKGTMCNFGQVCGGIKEKTIRTYNWNNKRLSKNYNKIEWLSHKFKTKEG